MIELTPFLTVYTCVLAAIIGLVMGSFLNCTAMRIVHGEPIARGRSHCDSCGHTLSAADLVPLFSWLFLKGRCRYCGAKLPAWYPITELMGAVLYVSFILKFGLSIKALEMLVLGSIVLCIAFCDIEDYLIPDRFIVSGIVWRVIFIFLSGNIREEAISSIIGGFSISLPLLIVVLIMDKILKKESMGGGDIKLFFMLGLYFSWAENLLALLLSCIFGIIFGLAGKKKLIPFGPAIACGYYAVALCGSEIVSLYLGMF